MEMKSVFSITMLLALCGSFLATTAASRPIDMDTEEEVSGQFIEVGTAYVTAGVWTHIATEYSGFSKARVFVSIIQSESSTTFSFPLAPRIQRTVGIGQASFDVSLFYPDGEKCQDYITPGVNDTFGARISWMVVEDGGYTLEDGKIQFVIGTSLVSSVPTRVFWSHRFGTYCSNNGGFDDVFQPGAIFTIQSVNSPDSDMFMVPRVSGWERTEADCEFSWKQAYMWVQGHSHLPRSTEIHEEVNYFLFSNQLSRGYAVRCINDLYTLSFATNVAVSNVLGNAISYGSPSSFVEEVGGLKDADHLYTPRVFGSVISNADSDSFVIYGVESTRTSSHYYLQEDGCDEHDESHTIEYFDYVVVGRDTASVDGFGNTVSCSDHAYTVEYYGVDAETPSNGSSTAAILAAFFVSFSIIVLFTCGITGPRLYAYLQGYNYDRSDSEGNWGIPGGTDPKDDVEDGSIDRSNTPFTHHTQAVVSDDSSTGGSARDNSRVGGTPPRGGLSVAAGSHAAV